MTLVESDVFLQTMGNVAASVTVVTSYDGDEPCGLTVSAFSSVSLDPPLVLVCIDNGSTSLPAIRERGGFTVNFMAEGTGELAMRMASKKPGKFDDVDVAQPTSDHGGPILAGATFAHFECQIESDVDGGDHAVLIGRVVAGSFEGERDPLVYWQRGFADLSKPE